MTSNPLCVGKDMGLNEAAALMAKHSVRHLIVTDGDKVVGIISNNDIDKFDFLKSIDATNLNASIAESIKIETFMTKGVHTLYEDETLKDAAEMLTLGAYHALPVVNFDNEVLGIVSSTDLILHMLKLIKE